MKVKVLGGPDIAEGLLTKQSEQDRGPGRNDHSNRILQDPYMWDSHHVFLQWASA